MRSKILEKDIKTEFFKSSGPGGQHRNVTESGVRIRHLPTGIVVSASESRSQARNREIALGRLERELMKREEKAKKRIATKVPPNAVERRLAGKRIVSRKKRLRSLHGHE